MKSGVKLQRGHHKPSTQTGTSVQFLDNLISSAGDTPITRLKVREKWSGSS